MKALVLAGSSGENSIDEKTSNKALIKIGGKEMILHVISTLKKVKGI